jgi:hypothetical protein
MGWEVFALLAVSSVMTMVGASRQASAQRAAGQHQRQVAEYQAAVARNNAIVSRRRAADIRLTAEHDAAQAQMAGEQLKSRQRAILAANGVVVDQDSALEATVDVSGLAKQDALTVTANAEKLALAAEMDISNALSQEQLLLSQGFFSETQANFAGDTTMLGGVTAVAGQWASFGIQGGFDGLGGPGGGGPSAAQSSYAAGWGSATQPPISSLSRSSFGNPPIAHKIY